MPRVPAAEQDSEPRGDDDHQQGEAEEEQNHVVWDRSSHFTSGSHRDSDPRVYASSKPDDPRFDLSSPNAQG